MKDNEKEFQGVRRDQIVTIGDLENFRKNLVEEIKSIFKPELRDSEKKWLRSSEVRKLLGISAGTLQNFRIKNLLPYKKIGGIVFYKFEDLKMLLERK
jgi:hypothetical protein